MPVPAATSFTIALGTQSQDRSLLPAYSICSPTRAEARQSHGRACDFPDVTNSGGLSVQRKWRFHSILPHSHVLCYLQVITQCKLSGTSTPFNYLIQKYENSRWASTRPKRRETIQVTLMPVQGAQAVWRGQDKARRNMWRESRPDKTDPALQLKPLIGGNRCNRLCGNLRCTIHNTERGEK